MPDLRAVADREGCSERHVRMVLNLAFLAPAVVKAAVGGTLPGGWGVVRRSEAPLLWARA